MNTTSLRVSIDLRRGDEFQCLDFVHVHAVRIENGFFVMEFDRGHCVGYNAKSILHYEIADMREFSTPPVSGFAAG